MESLRPILKKRCAVAAGLCLALALLHPEAASAEEVPIETLELKNNHQLKLSVVAGQYNLQLSPTSPSLLVATGEGLDIRLKTEGGLTVNGAADDPASEWLVITQPTTITLFADEAEPDAYVELRIEVLAQQDIAMFESLTTASTYSLNKSNERNLALKIYQSIWSSESLRRHPEISFAVQLRISDILRRDSRFQEALDFLDQSTDSQATTTKKARLAFERGMLKNKLHDNNAARKYFCITLLDLLPNQNFCGDNIPNGTQKSRLLANAVNNLGLLDHHEGLLQKAEERYHQALQLSPIGAVRQQALLENNLGGIAYSRGNTKSAIEYFNRAIDGYQSLNASHDVVASTGNLALAHLRDNQPDLAIRRYLWVLDKNRKQELAAEETWIFHRIGLLYMEMGEYREAKQWLVRSHKLKISLGLPTATTQNALGSMERRSGNSLRALEHHQSALLYYQEQNRKPQQIQTHLEIALAQLELSQLTKALENTKQAGSIAAISNDRASLGILKRVEGSVLRRLGQLEGASKALEWALELQLASGAVSETVITHYELALLRESQNNPTAAIRHLEQSISVHSELKTNISEPLAAATYSATYADVYGTLVGALIDNQQTDSALTLVLETRNQALLTSLYEPQGSGVSPLNAELISIKKELSGKQEAKQDLGAFNVNTFELEMLNEEIQDLSLRLDATEATLLRRSGNFKTEIDLQSLQRTLAPSTQLLVHHIGKLKSWQWQISSNEILLTTLPNRDALNEKILTLRDKLASSKPAVPLLDELRSVFFRDLNAFQTTKVILLPDQVTHQIPYAALFLGAGQPAPEIQLLAYPQRSEHSIKKETQLGALIIGDPVYSASDRRLDTPPETSTQDLPRLLHSAKETTNISRTLSNAGFNVTQLTGFSAVKESLSRRHNPRLSVVHLAVHGLIDLERPNISGLMFSRFNRKSIERAGLMTTAEIQDLNIEADLVVLSACDTASGTTVNNEGPISLSRAFLVAGATQVVSTLWKVKDRATSEFMDVFYSNWIKTGNAAKSVVEAQRTMAQSRRWKDPSNWAAFVAVGN